MFTWVTAHVIRVESNIHWVSLVYLDSDPNAHEGGWFLHWVWNRLLSRTWYCPSEWVECKCFLFMAFKNTESPGFTSASGTPFSCAGTEIEETTDILVSIFIYSASVSSPSSLWFVNGIRLGSVKGFPYNIWNADTHAKCYWTWTYTWDWIKR